MNTKTLKVLAAVFCIILLVVAVTSCASGKAEAEVSERDIADSIDKLGSDYTAVSFPGIGIEPHTIHKTAFSIGKITVRWYGLLITCGIILAFLYSYYMSKKEGIKTDDLLDMAIWGVVCGIVGARLYYVLTSLENYRGDFWSVFKIWEGGIAIYGAVIGGGIAIAGVCLKKKISILKAFDSIAPAVMIGQIIGRWGNFMNGEAYGNAVREGSPLYLFRMGIYPHTQLDKYITGNGGTVTNSSTLAYVHPTFLYESVWNLIGFILINLIYMRNKKKFDGQIFFMYITWYGFGRTFIELLRTDSLYIFGVIRISSLVGCLCFFFGLAMLIYGAIQGKKRRLAGEEYESAYPLFSKKKTETVKAVETVKTTETTETEPEETESEPEEPDESTEEPTDEDKKDGDDN